ncbi:hypothetical protein FB451DRAFT_1571960 [Mycena latifolia]|nr:hypothetical protein FB451DRAFT_1571960 [Mycena latifolia]
MRHRRDGGGRGPTDGHAVLQQVGVCRRAAPGIARGAGRARMRACQPCTPRAGAWGGPIDLDDLGLMKGFSSGMSNIRKLLPQLASYQNLLAEGFAERNPDISFFHAHPGSVDTPVLCAPPFAALCSLHYVRYLLMPGLLLRAKSIFVCGEHIPRIDGPT